MANYNLEEKESFIVFGIGIELKSHYTDFAGINKEKADFWQAVSQDGRLDTLKEMASNDYVFIVNEAVNNKMMHYAGVMINGETAVPELGETRVIQFPQGEYLVVKGEGNSVEELSNKVTGIAFGQALQEVNNVAYVGGPNAAVVMDQQNGIFYGEMWIPVVKK